MLFLDMQQYGIVVARVFRGLWLLPLGLLVLLLIGGTGHVMDAGAQLLVPDVPASSQFTFAFAMVAALGELLFALWLLIKGVHVERWRRVS